MIEIKELIIRAIVDTSVEKPESNNTSGNTGRGVTDDMFVEGVDQIIEIIKEKNER